MQESLRLSVGVSPGCSDAAILKAMIQIDPALGPLLGGIREGVDMHGLVLIIFSSSRVFLFISIVYELISNGFF